MSTLPDEQHVVQQELEKQRYQLLHQLEEWFEVPMLLLGFVWLALLIIELIWGLTRLLEVTGTVIWVLFILDFALKFTLAPHKFVYLRNNWLTALALLLPALRVFRIFRVTSVLRAAQTTRGIRLVRVVTSLNRGMKALSAAMSRRGFGYAVVLTILVTLGGAAGMYAFENEAADGAGFQNYSSALWWTAMLMTTLGSEYWPRTAEGRILCFLIALYAFAVFGYVTATVAAFFIGRDADNEETEIASAQSIAELRREIAELRADIRQLSHK